MSLFPHRKKSFAFALGLFLAIIFSGFNTLHQHESNKHDQADHEQVEHSCDLCYSFFSEKDSPETEFSFSKPEFQNSFVEFNCSDQVNQIPESKNSRGPPGLS